MLFILKEFYEVVVKSCLGKHPRIILPGENLLHNISRYLVRKASCIKALISESAMYLAECLKQGIPVLAKVSDNCVNKTRVGLINQVLPFMEVCCLGRFYCTAIVRNEIDLATDRESRCAGVDAGKERLSVLEREHTEKVVVVLTADALRLDDIQDISNGDHVDRDIGLAEIALYVGSDASHLRVGRRLGNGMVDHQGGVFLHQLLLCLLCLGIAYASEQVVCLPSQVPLCLHGIKILSCRSIEDGVPVVDLLLLLRYKIVVLLLRLDVTLDISCYLRSRNSLYGLLRFRYVVVGESLYLLFLQSHLQHAVKGLTGLLLTQCTIGRDIVVASRHKVVDGVEPCLSLLGSKTECVLGIRVSLRIKSLLCLQESLCHCGLIGFEGGIGVCLAVILIGVPCEVLRVFGKERALPDGAVRIREPCLGFGIGSVGFQLILPLPLAYLLPVLLPWVGHHLPLLYESLDVSLVHLYGGCLATEDKIGHIGDRAVLVLPCEEPCESATYSVYLNGSSLLGVAHTDYGLCSRHIVNPSLLYLGIGKHSNIHAESIGNLLHRTGLGDRLIRGLVYDRVTLLVNRDDNGIVTLPSAEEVFSLHSVCILEGELRLSGSDGIGQALPVLLGLRLHPLLLSGLGESFVFGIIELILRHGGQSSVRFRIDEPRILPVLVI